MENIIFIIEVNKLANKQIKNSGFNRIQIMRHSAKQEMKGSKQEQKQHVKAKLLYTMKEDIV